MFGTQQPHHDEALCDVLHWTRDGIGGDHRGLLLTSQSFDDGRCYQLGNGAALETSRKLEVPNPMPGQPGSEHELLCGTDVQIPGDVHIGKPYTLYWVWQWPNASGIDPGLPDGRDEYYTSYVDVNVTSNLQPEQAEQLLIQQDPMTRSRARFQSRNTLVTDPLALYSVPLFGGKQGSL